MGTLPRSTGLKFHTHVLPQKHLIWCLFFFSHLYYQGRKVPLSKRRDAAVLKSQLGELLTTDPADAGVLIGRVLHASCALSCLSMSALSLIAGKGCRPSGCCVQSSRHSSPGKFLLAHIGCQGGEDDHTADACQQRNCVNRKPSLLS